MSILRAVRSFKATVRMIGAGLVVVLYCYPMAAWAEYRLGSGDVVQLSVYGVPEMSRKVTVNVDGRISLHLLGEITASGLSLPELQERIQEALVENNVSRGLSVAVEIVEHRPFYISGQVAKPGAHPYRPEITVRSAIALAGGYDLTRTLGNQSTDVSDLGGMYRSLWLEFINHDAHVAGLKAELDGTQQIEVDDWTGAPVDKSVISKIAALESRRLADREAHLDKEREHIRRSIELADREVTELKKQLKQEEEGLRLQAVQRENAESLKKRGLGTRTNVAEQQRIETQMKSRLFETTARMASVSRQRAELERQFKKVQEERHLLTLKELKAAIVARETTRAKLDVASQKLLRAGALMALSDSAHRAEPIVRIHRKENGEQVSFDATLNDEILPGDIVEVYLKSPTSALAGRKTRLLQKNYADRKLTPPERPQRNRRGDSPKP